MINDKPLMKKIIKLLSSFFVIMVLVSPLYAQDNPTPTKGETPDEVTIEIVDGKEVIHTISAQPSEEDKDWPIVYHDISTMRDNETGKEYRLETTYRELVGTNTSLSSKDCPEDVIQQINSSNCTYYGLHSGTQTASGWGVEATVKQFSYKYCDGIDCNYYKPYKVERSWWRQSTGYSITNAWLEWGCSGVCLVCGGGTTDVVYTSSSITVGWSSDHDSNVYRTEINWFPIMQKVDVAGAHITAISHSAQVTVSVSTP